MNFPIRQTYRLAPRRGAGLCCDKGGIALGAADLVRVVTDAAGRQRSEVQPPQLLDLILSAAYGPQPDQVVLRLHRKLRRAASAIEAGDLCLAGIETVLLRLPDPTPSALVKLSEVAELHKWGTAWQYQPRVPPGQSGGGQWTTEDSASGAPAVDATAPIALHPSSSGSKPGPSLADGVYRPSIDAPRVIPVGGAEEEENSRRSNRPPPEYFETLEDVFPGLKTMPFLSVPLAPIDGFLGASALANETDLEAVMGQYYARVAEIKRLDPAFVDKDELLPPEGIAGLPREGRTNLLDSLSMRLAVEYYMKRGYAPYFQFQTLRFLQKVVDEAYKDALNALAAGRLKPSLSVEAAIGNHMDTMIRMELQRLFRDYNIPYGPGSDVTINNRDHIRPTGYRIPDARIRGVSYDWTLTAKTIRTPQINDYFRTVSRVRAVIVVRPSQLGRDSTYLIPRAFGGPL